VAAWAGSRSRLPSIRIPMLVIHGTEDRLVPLHYGEELARLVPGAKLVVLPGAGHMYITDSTAQADEAVTSFLTEQSLQPL
jgi:pimeloyl-ACP methyl ester carboxylesterase